MDVSFTFDAELWLSSVEGSWVFLTVPEDISDDIEDGVPTKGGFGSVKVRVNIGETSWSTSLFPDSKAGAYILPVKKAVRTAESVDIGDTVTVTVRPLFAE
ncbi:MAG: DUF1905 domain-containing protein [Acidimicrobiia bacterium]